MRAQDVKQGWSHRDASGVSSVHSGVTLARVRLLGELLWVVPLAQAALVGVSSWAMGVLGFGPRLRGRG